MPKQDKYCNLNSVPEVRIVSNAPWQTSLGPSVAARKSIISTFDIILTDIDGVKLLQRSLGQEYDYEVECRLRVLDSFGTDEIFNFKNSTIKPNYWGQLGLNLKQFWTFYPHNKDSFQA